MSNINENQIAIKYSQEETLMWKRVIRFDWVPLGSDKPELVVISLYHSDFDGYSIDWSMSDYPQEFRDVVANDNDLAELLDQLTWNFQQ